MAENAPTATRSGELPATVPVATVSAGTGPAANPTAPIPVATISVTTPQGTTVPVATVLVATVAPAATPATTNQRETAPDKTAALETAPPKPSEQKHGVWIWVVLALAIIGGIVGWWLLTHIKKPPGRVVPPVTISTTNAVRGEIDEAIE